MSRKNYFLWSLALCAIATTARAENTVTVGGEKMYPSKNIIQNAMKSADHTTLVTAVKAAGLVDTLQGKGPFTVFAPTNEAFAGLPAGTVESLLKPESKDTLVAVLTYHVVPGNFTAADIKKQADMNGGAATLKTVQGGTLKIMEKEGKWWVQDEKGTLASITIADVHQSNGVIHVIDHVLMP
jgi:uncharacterized surface protein with fasciclin (FAS1) repeats